MEQGNNAVVYIYINLKALRCAKKVATEWFTLSDAEENALEDNIVAMLEAEAELITNNEVEDLINSTAVHNFMEGAM